MVEGIEIEATEVFETIARTEGWQWVYKDGRPVLSSLRDIAKRSHHERYISNRSARWSDLTYEFSAKALNATQLFDQARSYRAMYDKHLTHGVNRCKYKMQDSQHC